MFDEAAESEGANHVTSATSAILRRRISAVRMACVLFLSITVKSLCPRCHVDDEFRLAARIGDSVIREVGGQAQLEALVLLGYARVFDQVISEQKSVPMLDKVSLHHVDMVSAQATPLLTLDEPGVKWRDIVSK